MENILRLSCGWECKFYKSFQQYKQTEIEVCLLVINRVILGNGVWSFSHFTELLQWGQVFEKALQEYAFKFMNIVKNNQHILIFEMIIVNLQVIHKF